MVVSDHHCHVCSKSYFNLNLPSKCVYPRDNTHSSLHLNTVLCPNDFVVYQIAHIPLRVNATLQTKRAKVCGCVFRRVVNILRLFRQSLGWLLWVKVSYSSAAMTADAHFLMHSCSSLTDMVQVFTVSLSFSHQPTFHFHSSPFFRGKGSGCATASPSVTVPTACTCQPCQPNETERVSTALIKSLLMFKTRGVNGLHKLLARL